MLRALLCCSLVFSLPAAAELTRDVKKYLGSAAALFEKLEYEKALVQIKRRHEGGTAQAVVGIVSGGLVTIFWAGLLVLLFVFGLNSANNTSGSPGPTGLRVACSETANAPATSTS